MLSAANEYEVLQLLLGECRERLAAYAGAQRPPPNFCNKALSIDVLCMSVRVWILTPRASASGVALPCIACCMCIPWGTVYPTCCTCNAGPLEEDMKLLQRGGLGPRERLAARLRLAEKRVLQSTMDAVRRCTIVQFLPQAQRPQGVVRTTVPCVLMSFLA